MPARARIEGSGQQAAQRTVIKNPIRMVTKVAETRHVSPLTMVRSWVLFSRSLVAAMAMAGKCPGVRLPEKTCDSALTHQPVGLF